MNERYTSLYTSHSHTMPLKKAGASRNRRKDITANTHKFGENNIVGSSHKRQSTKPEPSLVDFTPRFALRDRRNPAMAGSSPGTALTHTISLSVASRDMQRGC